MGSRTVISLLLLTLGHWAFGQDQHAYIKDLKAGSQDGRLLVSWITKAGFSCQDIVVQLSDDSVRFEDRATYYGLCGDTAERAYSLVIDSPFVNRRNFIRLDLGNFGHSYVIGVDVTRIASAKVIPNPNNGTGILHFQNPFRSLLELSIVDGQGRIVHRSSLRTDRLALDTLCLEDGLYHYRIDDGGSPIYRGRFLIQAGNGGCP